MYFRLTLFNGITLLLFALTAFMVYARFRFRTDSTWPLLYYVVVLGYYRGFYYSLNGYWVILGVACAFLLRFEFLGRIPLTIVRCAELLFFGYVLWRTVGLLLLWW
jgi:hypothetical protein